MGRPVTAERSPCCLQATPRDHHACGPDARLPPDAPASYSNRQLKELSMFFKIISAGILTTAALMLIAQPHARSVPLDAPRELAASANSNAPRSMVETVQYLPRSGFDFPRAGGAIVDWCASWANNCGGGGARQFCRSKGFDRALSWDIFHPGRTYVIGSNQYCDGEVCRGFRFVRCG